jgi:hypothetical protein
MSELAKYVFSLDAKQEKLFRTKFNYRQWRKICEKAGLPGLKFHDLRRYAVEKIHIDKWL